MKEIKNGEVMEEVIDAEELEETVEKNEESKLKVFGSKAKKVLKTHGKKIAAGALLGTGVLIGLAIGHKSNDDSDYDDIIDSDYVEFDEYESDNSDDGNEEETE